MAVDTAWVALSLLRHVGSKTLRALLAAFGTADAVLAAAPAELKQVYGVGDKIAEAIGAIDCTQTRRDIARWQAAGVQIITLDDDAYPDQLKPLADAPPTLFIRGVYRPVDWQTIVAIVGTRRPSARASSIALSLAARLVTQGCTIVSGLAFGVDAAAHRGALSISTGQTLAVLGCGVLDVYPPQHEQMARDLMVRGCLLSEQAPDAGVNAARLVSRNRIISGLAQHVIIVETSADGGAMHAARAAYAQGRHLYALDLPVSGNQKLIANDVTPIAPTLREFRLAE